MKKEVFFFICGLAIVALVGVEGRKELQLRADVELGGQCWTMTPSCSNPRFRGVCWRCQNGLSCEGQVNNEGFGVCKLSPGDTCGDIQCKGGEECCQTCNDQGKLVPSGTCAARCPQTYCVPKEPEESLGPDCNALPQSPKGNKFEDGCPGAVKKNGNPAKWFCKNNPWHKECCIWKRNKCSPKELEPDCNELPTSPRGDGFPDGCPGAVWKSGNPAKKVCLEKSWYKDCCIWKNKECAPKK